VSGAPLHPRNAVGRIEVSAFLTPRRADDEITPTFQPKAVCNGSISTPGVARRPAEESSARKMTPTTTNA
jgi:hypothetical protein